MAPNIDIDRPKKMTKGDIIGFVGDTTDNGGWPYHVYIEAYAFIPKSSNKIARVYGRRSQDGYRIKNKPISNADFRKIYTKAKAIGSYWSRKKINIKNNILTRNFYISRYQAIDANEIFDLYDQQTPVKKIII